jgi:hypothetical protein
MATAGILSGKVTIEDTVDALLTRPLKPETA